MKGWGFGLVTIGVIYLIWALNMDVGVTTSSSYVPGVGYIGGQTVANADLMSQRQNHTIIASLVTLVGVILAIVGWQQEQGVESAKAPVPTPRRQPETFSGEADLRADNYRLWLAETHSIERNAVFDKYVLEDRTYESLDEALAEAHRREIEKGEQKRAATEERERRAEERREEAEIARQLADEQWKEQKPYLVWGTVIIIGVIAFLVYASIPTTEERAAAEAAEKDRLEAEAAELEQKYEAFGVRPPESATNVSFRREADSFWCGFDETDDGEVMSFETSQSESEITDYFESDLGEKQTENYIDEIFQNEGQKYVFRMYLIRYISAKWIREMVVQ